MLRISSRWIRLTLLGISFLGSSLAWSTEFRTTREQTIVFDGPSHRSRKLSILSPDYPVEVLDRDEYGWVKIRDMSGDSGWIEEQSTAVRKRLLVRNNDTEILRRPDNNARLAFRAEKGVVLERLSSPDEYGWLKVRIPNTHQEGYVKVGQVWGIDQRRTYRNVAARREKDWDHDYEDSDYERRDVYRPTSVNRLADRDYEVDEQGDPYDAVEPYSTRKNYQHHYVSDYPERRRERRVAYRPVVSNDATYTRRVAKPKKYRSSVLDSAPAEPVVSIPRHHEPKEARVIEEVRVTTAKRKYVVGDPTVVHVSETERITRLRAAERAAARERLRERRLRAEQEARNQDPEYKRPIMYSTSRRNLHTRQDNWDRSDYADEDRDDRFNPPQVHH